MIVNEIISPEDGWKEKTFYLVDMALNKFSPIYRRIFYSGFLNGPNNTPGGCNCFFNTDNLIEYSDVYYMKVIKELSECDGVIV
jgi:hypothetical protein